MGKSNKAYNKHNKHNSKKHGKIIKFSDYKDIPLITRKKKVSIIPRNVSQEKYMFSIEDNTITFGVGPAGTGKTLLATLMAIKALRAGEVERIVITRPAVGVAGEEHGFLPGTLIEKMAPWTRPIFDVFEMYYTPNQLEFMIEDGVIEIAPLAYMRGRTFKNAWIIFDEAQNATPEQMKMAITRIGDECKMVITGDLNQHDRVAEVNGLQDFAKRLEDSSVSQVSLVKFSKVDIERHPIISDVLALYGE